MFSVTGSFRKAQKVRVQRREEARSGRVFIPPSRLSLSLALNPQDAAMTYFYPYFKFPRAVPRCRLCYIPCQTSPRDRERGQRRKPHTLHPYSFRTSPKPEKPPDMDLQSLIFSHSNPMPGHCVCFRQTHIAPQLLSFNRDVAHPRQSLHVELGVDFLGAGEATHTAAIDGFCETWRRICIVRRYFLNNQNGRGEKNAERS